MPDDEPKSLRPRWGLFMAAVLPALKLFGVALSSMPWSWVLGISLGLLLVGLFIDWLADVEG